MSWTRAVRSGSTWATAGRSSRCCTTGCCRRPCRSIRRRPSTPTGSCAIGSLPRLAQEPLPGEAPPLVVIATDGELYGHHQPLRDQFLARLVGRAAPPDVPYATPTLSEAIARAAASGPARRDGCAIGRRGAATTASPAGARAATASRTAPGRGRSAQPSTVWPAASMPPPSSWCGPCPGSPTPGRRAMPTVDVVAGAGDRTPRSRIVARAGRQRPRDRATFAAVMEAQRWRLAMFASCGWFWDDPARIETAGALRSAVRAARLDGRPGRHRPRAAAGRRPGARHRRRDRHPRGGAHRGRRRRLEPTGLKPPLAGVSYHRSVMTAHVTLSRRLFLAELGRGTVALAVVGIAGCTPAGSSATGAQGTPSPAPSGATSPVPSASSAGSADPPPGSPAAPGEGVTWERVNLGFVSAYILARGGEAAVVDTGSAGSEDDIAAALERIGLGWNAVGHVIATHLHSDHVGSLPAVLEAAPDATGYAGPEDLPSIAAPRPLVALADGDDVFGLTSHRDAWPHARLDLGARRSRRHRRGRRRASARPVEPVQGSNPQFTADMDSSRGSQWRSSGPSSSRRCSSATATRS